MPQPDYVNAVASVDTDLAPLALDVDPVEQVRQLEAEMEKFDPGLLEKPRWLVFTKADLLPRDEAQAKAEEAVAELGWQAPWSLISSVTHEGTDELMQRVSDELELIEDEERARQEPAGEQPEFPETPPEEWEGS